MSSTVCSLDDFADDIDDLWQPRVIGRLNDYAIKLVKVEGDFIWHHHPETDEMFLVLEGELEIGLRDPEERAVLLGRREVFVVPRGVEHRPRSEAGATMLLIEPATTTNTGVFEGDLPAGVSTTLGQDA